jgi:quercetin dioxygenase-like cupin family protein
MERTIVNPVIHDEVTFIKTAQESGGSSTELDIRLKPGGGNDLHYHLTYSEVFTAIEGDLGVRHTGKETTLLKPGESLRVEPGEIHAFYNPGEHDIRFKVELLPGHEGFEKSLRILYGLANDGLVNKKSIPKNLYHLAVIAKLSEMRSANLLLRAMGPLFDYLGSKAEKKGIEQKLIEKYCK